tara:strand:+ start:1477 stop:1740 length:264 start_codon:yes stop_codon:yes gene_type:complete
MNKLFPILILLISSIAFGFLPYQILCSIPSYIGINFCLPHWVFVYIFGLGSFALALFIKNGTAGYIQFITSNFRNFIQSPFKSSNNE